MGIDRSLILEGASIGYVEVFGEKDNEVFRFSYNNREYFVDDQYCMNPKCTQYSPFSSFILIKSCKIIILVQ
jgi:hypothetical protein